MAKYWRPSLVFPQSFQSVVEARAREASVGEMDLMRNAVYAAVEAPIPNRLTPWEETLLGCFNSIAAKSPVVAKDLERLIQHISLECAADARGPIAFADAAIEDARRIAAKTKRNKGGQKGA